MSHNLSSTCSTNTLSCLNKRPWIISRGQFLKYTEITFLHRELLKRPASLKKAWKVITAIKIKQKVKKKKKIGGESLSISWRRTLPSPATPRLGMYWSGIHSQYPWTVFTFWASLGMHLIWAIISSTLQTAPTVLVERYTLAYFRLYRIKKKKSYQSRNVSQELFSPSPSLLSHAYWHTITELVGEIRFYFHYYFPFFYKVLRMVTTKATTSDHHMFWPHVDVNLCNTHKA